YIDDYSFLIWGLLELYEATFETRYLERALEFHEEMLDRFWDKKNGGFYSTATDAEELLVRSKEYYDGAIPSGNSVGMLNLVRLARMTANPDYEERAAILSRAFSGHVEGLPSAHTQFLVGFDFAIGPSREVVIVGDSGAEDVAAMIEAVRKEFTPNKVVILRPTEEDSPKIDDIVGFTKHQMAVEGKATAYVCTSNTCKSPTTDSEEMMRLVAD
ncbi:MAG: thioredoxin domain-containing protein, partial [Thermoplasmata archaeon]|nr:thioredoxin domain-containing protein [Thermoplasmata archaeon]